MRKAVLFLRKLRELRKKTFFTHNSTERNFEEPPGQLCEVKSFVKVSKAEGDPRKEIPREMHNFRNRNKTLQKLFYFPRRTRIFFNCCTQSQSEMRFFDSLSLSRKTFLLRNLQNREFAINRLLQKGKPNSGEDRKSSPESFVHFRVNTQSADQTVSGKRSG